MTPSEINKRYPTAVDAASSFALQLAINEPNLFTIIKQFGSEVPVAVAISAIIADLAKFLHVSDSITADEIAFCAKAIIDNYKYTLTFADMRAFSYRIKCGAYGKLYNRFSAPDVMEYIAKYQSEKMDAAAVRDHTEYKASEPATSSKGLPYDVVRDPETGASRIRLKPKASFRIAEKCAEEMNYKEFMMGMRNRANQAEKSRNELVAQLLAKPPEERSGKDKYFLRINGVDPEQPANNN